MKTRVMAYAAIPLSELANIFLWIAVGKWDNKLQWVALAAWFVMAAVIFYSLRKIARLENDDEEI